MIEEIKKALEEYGGEWSEKKGIYKFEAVVAEQKAFLSKKKLTYVASIRIDDDTKTVKFSEMLMEAGSGLSSGDSGDDISPRFGFKAETYNTTKGPREGSIKEQSALFGKTYKYNFDYAEVRKKIEPILKNSDYKLKYQILSVK